MFSHWDIQNTLTAIGLAGAALTFAAGLMQYQKAQRWKRAEWVAQEMKSLLQDPMVVAALQMIDYGHERKIRLGGPNDAPDTVSDRVVAKALREYDRVP